MISFSANYFGRALEEQKCMSLMVYWLMTLANSHPGVQPLEFSVEEIRIMTHGGEKNQLIKHSSLKAFKKIDSFRS